MGPRHRGLEETRAQWLVAAGIDKRIVEVLEVNRMGWGARPWNIPTGRAPEAAAMSAVKSLAEVSRGQHGEEEPGPASGM